MAEPLNYEGPRPPDQPRSVRNFGVGPAVGIGVTALPWAIGYAGTSGTTVAAVAVAFLIGALVAASMVGVKKRYPGFAQGLLVTLGIAALVNGGICVIYVARHI